MSGLLSPTSSGSTRKVTIKYFVNFLLILISYYLYVNVIDAYSHVNSHFEDEDVDRDIELAKQISLASSISPPHSVYIIHVFIYIEILLMYRFYYVFSPCFVYFNIEVTYDLNASRISCYLFEW